MVDRHPIGQGEVLKIIILFKSLCAKESGINIKLQPG